MRKISILLCLLLAASCTACAARGDSSGDDSQIKIVIPAPTKDTAAAETTEAETADTETTETETTTATETTETAASAESAETTDAPGTSETSAETTQTASVPAVTESTAKETTAADSSSVVGRWQFAGDFTDWNAYIEFQENGTVISQLGIPTIAWLDADDQFYYVTSDGDTVSAPLKVSGDRVTATSEDGLLLDLQARPGTDAAGLDGWYVLKEDCLLFQDYVIYSERDQLFALEKQKCYLGTEATYQAKDGTLTLMLDDESEEMQYTIEGDTLTVTDEDENSDVLKRCK